MIDRMVEVLHTVVVLLGPWLASSGYERQAADDCLAPNLQFGSLVDLEWQHEIQLELVLVEGTLGVPPPHNVPN